MTTELPVFVHRDSLILVGDGQKALFLRNKGNARQVHLVVERVLERENPPTREQGTDRPGRSIASVGAARSAVEEADWHHLAKERFCEELAQARSIAMRTPTVSTGSSSLRLRKYWAIFVRPFIPR